LNKFLSFFFYSILIMLFCFFFSTFWVLFVGVTGFFSLSLSLFFFVFYHYNYFHLLIVQRIKKNKKESIWRSNRVQSNMQTTTLSSHRFLFCISYIFPSLLCVTCVFLSLFFFWKQSFLLISIYIREWERRARRFRVPCLA